MNGEKIIHIINYIDTENTMAEWVRCTDSGVWLGRNPGPRGMSCETWRITSVALISSSVKWVNNITLLVCYKKHMQEKTDAVSFRRDDSHLRTLSRKT